MAVVVNLAASTKIISPINEIRIILLGIKKNLLLFASDNLSTDHLSSDNTWNNLTS